VRRTLPLLAALALGCPSPPRGQDRSAEGSASAVSVAPHASHADKDTGAEAAAPSEGNAKDAAHGTSTDAGTVLAPDDPMDLHLETPQEILALFLPTSSADGGVFVPSRGLRSTFALEAGRFSQGNKRIARHAIGRRACLEGLRGIVIQTEEQRTICHGLENMVPIYGPVSSKGERAAPKACIDVFEFPNRACELPVVWGTPVEAANVCSSQGKRLCSQQEWNRACAGDPDGKADSVYAYGDELDLAICNTNKPHPLGPNGLQVCDPRTADAAWASCGTDTEPSGAFPRCRSRMGVFDQHGNVAEMMTRKGDDGVIYDQLKGSAFFYVDVARKPSEHQGPGRETYPDHCGYDPRWHVEPAAGAMHSNYHLGFRCCASL